VKSGNGITVGSQDALVRVLPYGTGQCNTVSPDFTYGPDKTVRVCRWRGLGAICIRFQRSDGELDSDYAGAARNPGFTQ